MNMHAAAGVRPHQVSLQRQDETKYEAGADGGLKAPG